MVQRARRQSPDDVRLAMSVERRTNQDKGFEMTTTTTTPIDVRVVQIDDRGALRAHLDSLNEAGIGCSVAGVAGNGQPFLIELSGCYAETETVLWGDPWASDVEHSSGVRCEECGAHNLYGIDSLRFPVHILTTVR